MIVALALAALLAQPAAATSAPAPSPPAPSPAAPSPPAATPPADDPAADLDQLRQMYRDTCSAREFGAYDDMCDQLHQQVRLAERRAAEAARRHPSAAAAPR